MTSGKATVAVLRVGDRVRFDGMVQTVVGLSGTLYGWPMNTGRRA
jgi:hypothetical protein